MFDKILVPMALDHGVSGETLAAAQKLLNPGGEITALHVFEVSRGLARAYLGEDALRKGFDRAADLLKEKTANMEGVKPVIRQGHAYRTISDYAAENDIGCIVIASHKPEFADYLLGSTAAKVVRHATCAVFVHR
ncbi:nucleotide-binding universal stress UspA family protein [Shimia isoporae]|uniref:Nucleotide-binding universal stress UspA family protein n=1 Tax=Shimia isoporae TaxID=647720 RepID=A0A4R1N055_9RHOB|nr:universal stress protein [Shimia isoporae]TCK99236.1 nucleotide-binding universal stress UspA family protein [Shimia isoporae]